MIGGYERSCALTTLGVRPVVCREVEEGALEGLDGLAEDVADEQVGQA